MNNLHHLLRSIRHAGNRRRGWSATRAFTLTEVMVAGGVFTLVMGSILLLFVAYSRAASGINRQLEMDSKARVLYSLGNDIKSAEQIILQTFTGSSFITVATNQVQQGNALALTLPNGLTNYPVFYWVNPSGTLYRAVGNIANAKPCLDNITNFYPFAFTTFAGSTLAGTTQANVAVSINLFVLDSNVRNYRQSLLLSKSASQRNRPAL